MNFELLFSSHEKRDKMKRDKKIDVFNKEYIYIYMCVCVRVINIVDIYISLLFLNLNLFIYFLFPKNEKLKVIL